jgi:hypothetical protein
LEPSRRRRGRNATSDVGQQRFAFNFASAIGATDRVSLRLRPLLHPDAPDGDRGNSQLVGWDCGFFLRLRCAFVRTEVLAQVSEKSLAILVRNDGTEPFHFLQFAGPLLLGQVLLRDPGCIVTLHAGRFDFALHRSRGKGLAGRTAGLRADQCSRY